MKKIGQSVETLTIQDEPENTKPVIDAICEAKSIVFQQYFKRKVQFAELKILDLEDSSGASAFQRVIKECSTSLKKITVCLNAHIPEIGDIDGLYLDELLIETDLENNFNTFLNKKCCRTKSLIFDLYQFLPTSSFNWDYLVQSFSGVKK
uniref:Uncharacterized protein n=1 Tax=Panagrolaimus sp. ES5 TaxID=591445 RepID=A0AC34GW58_9BILA